MCEFLTEEDILNDVLLSEKNISNCYSIAINEMSNAKLYKKIMSIFEDTKDISRDMFNLMYQNGWYQLESEDETKIETSFDKYNKKYEELF
ncbi:MAG: spore coat protein [Bacilli bacterium]|nr:spore coat protein [bacterium]